MGCIPKKLFRLSCSKICLKYTQIQLQQIWKELPAFFIFLYFQKVQGFYLPCHAGSLMVCSFYSRFIPEDEVEYKAYYCKDNACSSQDGEDDSEGKIY